MKTGGNLDKIQEKIEKEAAKRARKKKPKMRVSGKSVFKLQSVIRKRKS